MLHEILRELKMILGGEYTPNKHTRAAEVSGACRGTL